MRGCVKVTPNLKILIIENTILVRLRAISQIGWEHVMPHLGGHGITREANPTLERRFETDHRLTSKN